jgi:serine/threonine protein kinase
MSDSEMAPTQLLKLGKAANDPLVDTIVGERYRILSRIGEGGMGTVFRVEHTLMKKVLALKLLRSEFCDVPDAAKRFEREAQSASWPTCSTARDRSRSAAPAISPWKS